MRTTLKLIMTISQYEYNYNITSTMNLSQSSSIPIPNVKNRLNMSNSSQKFQSSCPHSSWSCKWFFRYIPQGTNIWYPPPPPKIYLFCFFTGIYVVLQQVRAFPQKLIFEEGDIYVYIVSPKKPTFCLEPNPSLPKKRFPYMYHFFLFSL